MSRILKTTSKKNEGRQINLYTPIQEQEEQIAKVDHEAEAEKKRWAAKQEAEEIIQRAEAYYEAKKEDIRQLKEAAVKEKEALFLEAREQGKEEGLKAGREEAEALYQKNWRSRQILSKA
ncbi:hypothetical protein G4V62_03860 [Bacillaceae bacterium SIJ1]|uniref:hypothetical protein n=1 Tax=Litoribacterium kuwaitense TaxID=1398745 RepID=UPI0013EA8C25|nr:hypothetical protein [Litoribacterium kuwaitense]NGP44128.1 hypothetical protein [Litoribacterium kuwaitense]